MPHSIEDPKSASVTGGQNSSVYHPSMVAQLAKLVSHCRKQFDSAIFIRDNALKSSDGVGDLPINSNFKVYHVVLASSVDSEYCRSAGEISLFA
ncbi:hypothetical protein MES5069_490103 [Mesorhizobium escarrei]|uniref:Uncharacterized protein n=1 Tax=Mesorhizobium escarrei TaxID=666018 RepID=A0ABM9E9E0_9HYPH|nr:hypothetical protein MES5069_490103 [Mesorhizobium escarrei]